MAKNIEFKGLLNTVPYFCVWGNVWELCGKYMGGQWEKMIIGQIWLIKYEKQVKWTEMACKMGID